jgi:two-component system cell cycle sensor histidine kinase PleC
LPSFYAFIPGVVLPFGVFLALNGGPAHVYTAALLAVWVCVIAFLAHLLNDHITDRLLLLDRAMLTDAMERSRDAADAANRAKTRLLANVSHELRTPLNAIIGFSEIMSAELFGPHGVARYRDYSDDIKASGSHLLNVINDILDTAKLEAGRIQLNESTANVAELVEQAAHMLHFSASRGSVNVATFVPRDVPNIRVDVLRFRQVLINLLSNAVKFTPVGGLVDVEAERSNGEVRVSVADTGPGIAAEDLDRIFEEFQQTETGARQQEGTGLGLALSKCFVEMHGGRIWCDSEIGKGSTFVFTLPVGSG